MSLISEPKDLFSGLPNVIGKAVVHGFRGHEADAGVPVLFVIPWEERLTVVPGVLDASEPLRKVWTVLEGLELSLRVRVVIARMGSAVGLGNPQISK